MKKRKTIYIFSILVAFLLFSVFAEYNQNNDYADILETKKLRKEMKRTTAIDRAEWEFMMLRNPKTNEIPRGIFAKEQDFAKTLPKLEEKVLFKNGSVQNTQAIGWQERGPNNVGGRTRAFAADSRNKDIINAGGISGGMWRSVNGGTSWTQVTSASAFPPISCIVQDPRNGQENTWYAGTGEQQGNSSSATGASYFGNGIYKSTDNGASWSLLPSTSGGNVYTWDNDWEFSNSIGISPTTGTIFVAENSSIRRSTNGGTTWSVAKGDLNSISRSEVTVNSTGHIYASISSSNAQKGIWKSTDDGINWTNITPVAGVNSTTNFPGNYPRVILAHAPNNNNKVYILAYTPSAGQQKPSPSTDGSSLWMYDASLNGTAQWVDRSSNLPTWVNPVGGMDTQGGYNLILNVKPDDENFVIVGTTSLFRSTDGFTTKAGLTSTHWIGGYSIVNNISQYASHHPDVHTGYFEPGNTGVYYSGHDGGLSKTTNIAAAAISWSDIDDTYNVTQFYSVSIDPELNGNYMSAGAQDNGVKFTPNGGLANWSEFQGGGDGAFTEVAPLADDRVYTETQNGNIAAFTRTNGYMGSLKPSGSTNQLFVNPFILDPNNSSLLYYGGGNNVSNSGIWLNTNPITGGSFANPATPTGWTFIASNPVDGLGDGKTSAIDVSYTNSANVVYFGTNDGKVFKITDPTGTPVTTNVSTGLPGAYVSGIAIDPTNSNNVMVVFSNYGVNSIYYTSTGGTSWTFVEGNLNAAIGPSVRSCEIFQVDGTTHYFVGTSIGLYFTLTLNGVATVWTQEASSTIGNTICAALDWRSDLGTIAKSSSLNGTQAVGAVSIAVGTHGRGAFQGTLVNPLPVELTTFVGNYNGNSVELIWETATEVNNYGFEIERKKSDQSEWESIEFISGHGNSNSAKQYSFTDNNLYGSEKFYYRLKQIDIDGTFEYSSIVEIVIVIEGFELSQNYPNPFNPTTNISYTIPEIADVKVEIYSITGELVTQLVNSKQNAGNYSVDFNAGEVNDLSSGMYIYRISAIGISGNNFVKSKKMLMIK